MPTGECILVFRALLDEQLSSLIEQKDMHSPVSQLARMHFGARRLANDPICLVHDVENFIGVLHVIIKTHSWQKESPPECGGLSAVSF